MLFTGNRVRKRHKGRTLISHPGTLTSTQCGAHQSPNENVTGTRVCPVPTVGACSYRVPGCEPPLFQQTTCLSVRVEDLDFFVNQNCAYTVGVRRYGVGYSIFRIGDTYSDRVPGFPGTRISVLVGYQGNRIAASNYPTGTTYYFYPNGS